MVSCSLPCSDLFDVCVQDEGSRPISAFAGQFQFCFGSMVGCSLPSLEPDVLGWSQLACGSLRHVEYEGFLFWSSASIFGIRRRKTKARVHPRTSGSFRLGGGASGSGAAALHSCQRAITTSEYSQNQEYCLILSSLFPDKFEIHCNLCCGEGGTKSIVLRLNDAPIAIKHW